MNKFRRLRLLAKEIGIPSMSAFIVYRFKLASGIIMHSTPTDGMHDLNLKDVNSLKNNFTYSSNWKNLDHEDPKNELDTDAELLLNGFYRPFRGELQPLTLIPPASPLQHWTEYSNEIDGSDIKSIWEPARFSWSLDLAHAFRLTGDDKYAELFWKKVEEFTLANPTNVGPNWASAQEVAMRLICWSITLGAIQYSISTTSERLLLIANSIFQHAQRILPTMGYARAQNNNHILSEALGLMVAGDLLTGLTKQAEEWKRTGEREFVRALTNQIDEYGTYIQHSANYHRLMLHLALLYDARTRRISAKIPQLLMQKLALATRWLTAQLDPISGRLPNLGHNDGTLLLPFGCGEYRDYRPTAQAASLAFLGHPALQPGKWDELANWLGQETRRGVADSSSSLSPAIHKVGKGEIWGTLRGVKYNGRPAHADQLHVDLWWKGENIARDAGTYSYNAAPPWQNALDRTRVHNTITIDQSDQMERMSRFLWLNQAQVKWEPALSPDRVSATHNGYRKLGIQHHRALEYIPDDGFVVTDKLIMDDHSTQMHNSTLHWLLPDWKWELKENNLFLNNGGTKISIRVNAYTAEDQELKAEDSSVIRAGQPLAGSRLDPILGWESSIYNEKCPVLSFSCSFQHSKSIKIITTWEIFDA